MSFVRNIQALRFGAALAIVFLHLGPIVQQANGTAFDPLLAPFMIAGNAGVDVFFVISGFVIYTSTQGRHHRQDLLPFMLRRLSRIYLGYWPWLIAFSGMIFLIGSSKADDYGILKSITLARMPGQMIVPVSWSLVYEVEFYMVFGVSMLLPRKYAITLMLFWGFCGWVFGNLLTTVPTWIATPYTTEFAAGIAIAILANRIRFPTPSFFIIAAILQIVYTMWFFSSFSLVERTTVFGCFAIFLVCAMVSLEQRNIVASDVMVSLGGSSYTLYLAHIPFIFMTQDLLGSSIARWPSFTYGLMTLCAVAFSLVWYNVVERPVYIKFVASVGNIFAARQVRVSRGTAD